MHEESLVSTHERYMRILVEDLGRETNYDAKTLQLKLKEYLKEYIVFETKSRKSRTIIIRYVKMHTDWSTGR